MKRCSVCEKEYNQELIKHLDNVDIEKFKNHISELMEKKLHYLLIERLKNYEQDAKYPDLIHYFHIKTSEKPIYYNLNKESQLDDLIDHIINLSIKMEQTIGAILKEYEGKLEKELYKNLHSIWNLISRFVKQLKKKKGVHEILKGANIEDMRYEFFKCIKNNFNTFLLDRIISPIYNGMKEGNVKIYESILIHINKFLSDLGINTIPLIENQDIDYNLCKEVNAYGNETTDAKLKNCIKTIIQLPYVFDKNHIVKEGEIVGWEFTP